MFWAPGVLCGCRPLVLFLQFATWPGRWVPIVDLPAGLGPGGQVTPACASHRWGRCSTSFDATRADWDVAADHRSWWIGGGFWVA